MVGDGDMDKAQGEVEALVAKGVTPNEVTTFNMLACVVWRGVACACCVARS